MCEHGDLAWMPELGSHGRYVDRCMVPIIREHIRNGTGTIACCCGHGKYPMTVIYRALGGNSIEYYTRTILLRKNGQPRIRNLYTMDEEGLYFIKELKEKSQ